MMKEKMDKQLKHIRRAYDLTVEQYYKGIDPYKNVPKTFKNSSEFKVFIKSIGPSNTGSAVSDIREYLKPKPGMRFLDAGCCANLANYRLDRWRSTYFGVDVSPALINAMKNFVSRNHISIGGLWVADISELPFDDNFFDIAAIIGVLQYYTLGYIKSSLCELNRVLKPKAKMVLDIPNHEHPHFHTMLKLEEYLSRPNIPHPRTTFEELLKLFFVIEKTDDSHVMLKYFVRTAK